GFRGRSGSSSTSGTSSIARSSSTCRSSGGPPGRCWEALGAWPWIPTRVLPRTRPCDGRRSARSRSPARAGRATEMARGVSLRDSRPEDAAAVPRWFNSPAATANLLEHRDEFTEDDAGRWVERAIDQAGDPDAEDRKWAVEVEGIDEPVGYTALYGL